MDEIRIGVFICNCGTNIAGFLDAGDVAAYASCLPHVVFTRENLFSCSESGVTDIRDAITENSLNRVVVAACTPRTHEPTFRATCAEAGLNPYLFEFVNIREQCSWVHKEEWEAATGKARDLVRMAVARVALLEPQERIRAGVQRHVVVVGGGVAGMTVARELACKGVPVTLIERERSLGGLTARLNKLYPKNRDAASLTSSLERAVRGNARVTVMTGASLEDVAGYIGKYVVTVSRRGRKKNLECGAIVVATGARPLDPEELADYDGRRVITLFELERKLRSGRIGGKNFVFITCAGARNEERPYCSRVCCIATVKNALLLKKAKPGAKIHVLYRDLMCYGISNEELLRSAKKAGILFVSYAENSPPVIENGTVRVVGDALGTEFALDADTVVLATPLVPADGAAKLSRMLKVPLDADGFFLEAHVKLRPVEFSNDGIYLCGAARWPSTVRESIEQALGAAAKAAIPLLAGEIEVEPIIAALSDPELCRGCGMCASICPYGSIEMVETENGVKASMIEVACKGCGTCAATCYMRAITMVHYTDDQLGAQARVAFAEETKG